MSFSQDLAALQQSGTLNQMFAAENAANSRYKDLANLEKLWLDNAMTTQKAPDELAKSQWEGAQARGRLEDPNHLKALLAGEKGDYDVKALAGAQANIQNTPELLRMFGQFKEAGYQDAIRKNEIDTILHKFRRDAAPYEGQMTVDKARGGASVMGNQAGILTGKDQYGQSISEPVLANMRKNYGNQVGIQGYTPEHWSKAAIEDIKGRWDLQKANIMASAQRDAASTGGKAAWAQAMGPATQLITQTQNALAKLNSNEMDEQLAGMIATRGLKPGTPEFEAALKTEKDNLRVELNKQLTEGTKFLQDIRTASGLGGSNPAQPQVGSQGGQQAQFTYVPGQGLVPANK